VPCCWQVLFWLSPTKLTAALKRVAGGTVVGERYDSPLREHQGMCKYLSYRYYCYMYITYRKVWTTYPNSQTIQYLFPAPEGDVRPNVAPMHG
jgi:hypothetical protein